MAHSSETLIGRDAELTGLAATLGILPGLGSPAPARPGGVLLSGDAGVGKTRLLMELRDLARSGGWRVLAGHCLDFGESALAYLPFSEVLGRLATELPEVVDQVVSRHPALGRLQPGRRILAAGGGPEDPADGGLDRAALFEGVHALLEEVARSAPVLLVIEDVHWADRSTRDLLGFLFSRPFAGPVSVVASYRSDDLHRRHPLRGQVAEWARLRGVERVALEPLSEGAVRALVVELARSDAAPLDEARVRDIVRRAEGNAFFVEELVASSAGPDRWVPDDLRDVLLVRLDRLDETARQVVRAASVAGRRVGHELLAAAAGVGDGDFDAAVRQAVEMNVLVSRNARYEFRHALLGEAVYDDLLPGERVRLHARFAEALVAGAPGTAAELARHARRAHDDDTAARASVEAGVEAYEIGGPDEAAQHYQQALELLEDQERCERLGLDRSKIAVAAALALSHSGRSERAAALLREQLDALPPSAPTAWRTRLLTGYATVLLPLATDEDLDPLVFSAEAVQLAEDGVLRAKALSTHARALAQDGRLEEAQSTGLEALALAERHDRPALVAEIVTTLGGLKRTGPREALEEALTGAVERARRTGAVESELRARFLIGRAHQDAGEWPGAIEWYRSALDRGMAVGQPWAPYCIEARWQLSWVQFVIGEWDQVVELTAIADDPDVPKVPRGMLLGVALAVPLHRGDDVDAQLADLRVLWEREGAIAIHAAGLQIMAATMRGDAATAVSVYDDAVDVLSRVWHPLFGARVRLAALAVEAVATALPGLPAAERASWLAEVDRLLQDGRTVVDKAKAGSWGVEGRAWSQRLEAESRRAHWAGGPQAPARDDLLAAWTAAEAAFVELGHVHELARVRTTMSGLLRALGDAAEARRLGDLAREAAHRLGARPLLDQLVEVGSQPARAAAQPATLTPRESEILALVAEGRSNGEIGKQLYISTKTVSVHVSNILGKLGAASRTEAAALARRRGLLA